MEFEWDDDKAATNRGKHRVSFEEASEVFSDAPKVFEDSVHSADEDRLLAVGFSNKGRMLIVSHTYRDGRIRIISDRLAAKLEKDWYGKTHS